MQRGIIVNRRIETASHHKHCKPETHRVWLSIDKGSRAAMVEAITDELTEIYSGTDHYSGLLVEESFDSVLARLGLVTVEKAEG